MIDFKKKMEEGNQPPKPHSHPPVPDNMMRIRVESIETTTDKAILIRMETGRKVWIPKSVSKYRNGSEIRGVNHEDRMDVIDVEKDFYDQNIGV